MALWFRDPLASQRSVANQDPRSDTATTALVVVESNDLEWQFSSHIGDLETSQLENSSCIVEAVLVEMQYWNTTRELS